MQLITLQDFKSTLEDKNLINQESMFFISIKSSSKLITFYIVSIKCTCYFLTKTSLILKGSSETKKSESFLISKL